MSNSIDVHVLHCYEPKEWIDACLLSMKNEPVNVYLCDGIKGHVGLARAKAFEKGSAEFVAFVDGDDEVIPGAFDEALQILNKEPKIVSTYCDVQLIDAPQGVGYLKEKWKPITQFFRAAEVHHLHVMRREAVMHCLKELKKWPGYEEYVLMGLLCQFGQHYHIPKQLYRFRQHTNYHRAGQIGGTELFIEAQKLVFPILHKLFKLEIQQED